MELDKFQIRLELEGVPHENNHPEMEKHIALKISSSSKVNI